VFDIYTDQSGRLEDERSTKERQVVPCIEAVPDRTEQEDAGNGAPALVDDVAQPDHCRHVPVIQHLLHARAQLPSTSTSQLCRKPKPPNCRDTLSEY